ncbi:MAG TPA: GNAT family N-acetyltransferase [Anaerolineae bacterium]|nr:GNAT family N-acetyltransferase [Anaerolineae bacterium]
MTTKFLLRFATVEDIPVLVSHRRKMFEDMAALKGEPHDRAGLEAMDAAYAVILRYEIPAGSTRVWVIEDDDQIAASGALKFTDWLPRPDGSRRGLVYVHSVYTEPAYRRQGLARQILTAMMADCRANGWPRISLHASELGRGLYESLGFKPTNEMRLVLE